MLNYNSFFRNNPKIIIIEPTPDEIESLTKSFGKPFYFTNVERMLECIEDNRIDHRKVFMITNRYYTAMYSKELNHDKI